MTTPAALGIESLVVCDNQFAGGRPYVTGTRVTVSWIANLERQGLSAERMQSEVFEGRLSVAQIYAALAYYHQNRTQIDEIEAQRDADYLARAAASDSLADRPG